MCHRREAFSFRDAFVGLRESFFLSTLDTICCGSIGHTAGSDRNKPLSRELIPGIMMTTEAATIPARSGKTGQRSPKVDLQSPTQPASPAPTGKASQEHSYSDPTKRSIRWDYTIFFVALHLLTLLVLMPYFFSWAGVAAFVVGVVVFGQMAIPIGYHRMLSHRSFRSPKWFERTLVTLAMCTAQETPAHWVAWHRMHHSHSDHAEDPHSPRISFMWAHVRWLVHESRTRMATFSMYEKYARDILSDPYYRWIEKLPSPAGMFYLAHAFVYALLAVGISMLVYGNNAEAYRMAASVFVWGVIARTVWVWHITWSVNSITHVFGYRNYQTTDDSRNNWFVSLLTAGEGWHNNHHADPASASVQHRWWEIDPNYYVIRLFGALGLATHIIRPRHVRKSGAES
ncbi:Stearoyl-CoA 9-desaturase [Rhodopirellula europaea SH398]|uniref:Stearoyl-CoA 9-desaturase n=1 Tax=Rhodopirellula europaea SH398 TaxID=1263868 RepID=M5SCN4_9BACT|nr:Stearoyl-CoA 9-desaturase [Rhodopirellula europaea SH398]